jgi:hypothetical protein
VPVYKQNISMNLNGSLAYVKFTIDYITLGLMLGATTSGDIPLFTLPQGAKVFGIMTKHSTAFTGITGPLVLSVGTAANATIFQAATGNLMDPVADTTSTESGGMFTAGQLSAAGVIAHFISSSGVFTSLTAGVVDIYVCWMPVSTPNV